ncbi:MAG TPA: hypothetical protein DCM28_05135 [Phycisphaerales bacterium]|nr:hypothetical protein [Phycisphaerales bacterium]HCD34125.1 hypothetical protein [Phycisphaerales bacterium]|tara:strand:- start:47 stop:496 length:450 start_codon:yes stop_codon:yes gene_type:complete
MAEAMSITITLPPSLLPTDQVYIIVDGETDTITENLLGIERASQGFGHGLFGATAFGSSVQGPGFGNGPFGLGPVGHGIDTVTLSTVTEYVAGDYQVKTQSIDDLGNTGTASAEATIQHRPTPPPPYSLAITTGTDLLTWSWQDPAPIA